MLRARNFSKRPTENTPPVKASVHSPRRSHARRSRKNPASSRFNVEQARRKAQKQPVRLNVVVYANDVEMHDAPAARQPKIVPVVLPRALRQPPVSEPSEEAMAAASGSRLSFQPAAFVRESLAEVGPDMLQTTASVSAQVDNATLPKELNVLVNDLSSVVYPTHMLAVYAPVSKAPASTAKTQVKLYPVHSLVMAAHCAKLGPFTPSPTSVEGYTPTTPGEVTLPVRPLCLPHPASFPNLLQYFYLRRPEVLFSAFLPSPPPVEFVEDCSSNENIMSLADHIGRTFNATVLLERAAMIHGVWMNACALGAFDEGLWAAIDSCYEVILNALAIGTGNPRAVYIAPSPTPTPAN